MFDVAPMSARDELLEIQLSPGSLPFSGMLDQWTSSTNTIALFPRTSV
jgi:hypothetical protein